MSDEYSQGVAHDGAVILHHGIAMTPDEIVLKLNHYTDLEQQLSTLLETAQATVDEWRNTCSTEAIRALEAVLEDKAGST